MSMLGIALLNEIVRKSEIKNSAQVLNELRNQIKLSLQQTGENKEQQDGMDITFLTIDKKNNSLSFAGANNPLWIFRNNELIEIKGDKMPVSVYIKKNPFTNFEILLQKMILFICFLMVFTRNLIIQEKNL